MTGKGERAANVLEFAGNQRSLCLQVSGSLLLVPPTTSLLWMGLLAYPTHLEGEEAESAAAAEDAVCRGQTLLSVCLPVCLGFQGVLPGGGEAHRPVFS